MDFTLNLFGRKLNDGIRDLAAMLRLWNRDVKIFIDKKTLSKLKKAALTSSEFEKYGHICIKNSINFELEIVYDINSLEVVQLDIKENEEKKVYVPYKRAKRKLFIVSKKRH